jgi:hypothetical protein
MVTLSKHSTAADRQRISNFDHQASSYGNTLDRPGRGLAGGYIETLYSGCCGRLHTAGIPISRGPIGFIILNPLFVGMSLTGKPNA